MSKSVVGILDSRPQAELLLTKLENSGFTNNNISVLFPDKKGTQDFAHEHNTKSPEGAVAGASTGGVIGGTVGLLAGIGALAIPGLGPLIAAGPLLATLSGVATGAALGGLTGALIGLGIPELEAKVYEGKVKGGNLLIAVHASTKEEQELAEKILKAGGAIDISMVQEKSPGKPEQAHHA